MKTSLAQPAHSHKAFQAVYAAANAVNVGASALARPEVKTVMATRCSGTSEGARAYIDLQTGVN